MLAALTIVLTIPTIIASFFGMNVPVPFADTPVAFVAVAVGTFLLTALVALLFHRKRWL